MIINYIVKILSYLLLNTKHSSWFTVTVFQSHVHLECGESVTTSKAEFGETEDPLFFTFCCYLEPLTNGLSIESLQLLVVDIESSESV